MAGEGWVEGAAFICVYPFIFKNSILLSLRCGTHLLDLFSFVIFLEFIISYSLTRGELGFFSFLYIYLWFISNCFFFFFFIFSGFVYVALLVWGSFYFIFYPYPFRVLYRLFTCFSAIVEGLCFICFCLVIIHYLG